MSEFRLEHLIRQSEIIPARVLGEDIYVIGAGAIGSFVVLSLVKMGFHNLTVFDDDKVSPENMSNQWFRVKDIGSKKVDALRDLIKDFTGIEISVVPRRYGGESMRGIVIVAVDSMEARRSIWHKVKKDLPYVRWFIDPRMASEYALLYTMNPHLERDVTSYEKTLYPDTEAVQERCTAKSTMYTATMIAGLTAKAVKSALVGTEDYPRVVHWDIKANDFQAWVPEK